MTSHFFTPENQSFDETEIPPSPDPAAKNPFVYKDATESDRGELYWYDLCNKDRSWGQCIVAKLIEERNAHEKTKKQLQVVEKERDRLKMYHRDITDDKMVMRGMMDCHRV